MGENEPEKVLQLNPICAAYMFCSYSSLPNKHRLKESIHKLIRRKKISEPLMKYEEEFLIELEKEQIITSENSKPTLFIIHEKLTKFHAMRRCFENQIVELQKVFYTVGVTFQKGNIDSVTYKLFNKHYIAEGKGITDRTA